MSHYKGEEGENFTKLSVRYFSYNRKSKDERTDVKNCITASGKNSSTLSCELSRKRRKIIKPPTFARAPKTTQVINFWARPVQSIRVFCAGAQKPLK